MTHLWNPKIRSLREYDFSLVLTGVAEVTSQVEDALFEAGCDDATICVRFGAVSLSFSRAAASLKEAVLSAIRDVRKANVGAEVLRVDVCSLVTQAEIARKIGRSRQIVHQYIIGQRGPGGFPVPVCDLTDGAPLWYWCEVAHWLHEHDMISASVLRDAEEAAAINTLLELAHQRRMNPALFAEIEQAVGGP